MPDTEPTSDDMPQESTPGEPWYAEGLSFNCTQCGGCCTGGPGYVWFDDDEAQAMADVVGMDKGAFYQRYAQRKAGRWSLDEIRIGRGKYDCVFLERPGGPESAGRCTIYSARPTQCRTWPFWESNLTSPRAWAEASEDCPGMVLPDEVGGNFVPLDQITVELAKNPQGL
ncbi:MAG: YkgJ family cysteine cluster protein [Algisphaera sp.]